VKIASIENPVKSDWFIDQGLRLDVGPYLSGAIQARERLEGLPNTERLDAVAERIFHAGRYSRRWVTSRDHGVPFFSSTDILESDYSFLPLIAKSSAAENPRLPIEPGWTLITRSGSIGRMAYARPDVDGYTCSEDVLRVVPGSGIPAGYLYTFLRSRFGVPMIVASAYGAIIQHIEPSHLADLPVPRFASALEQKVHNLVEESAKLRAAYQAGLTAATEDFFHSVGLPEFIDFRWHDEGRDLGFEVADFGAQSIRALNFSPRARRIVDKLSSVQHRTLGDICEDGLLSRGVRFKRIDSDADFGVPLVGQRQAFWVRPEGRMLAVGSLPSEVYAENETILVASQGTLGEQEVFCRAFMVTGAWLGNAYSEHFLRVVSGDETISGAYLFAFLRSSVAFRIFRSLSTGGKQQDIHEGLRRKIPVPLATLADRQRIAETVRQAYQDRARADVLDDEALSLLTKAIEEAKA
jgi:hypothetical protein